MNSKDTQEQTALVKKPLEPVAARKDSPLAQFSEKIGKVEILEKETGSKSLPTHGFFCVTCKASFTSSDAYLDHCNGRIHQRNLGLSLKVQRVEEVDRVKARLETLTKKRISSAAILEADDSKHFEKKLDDAEKAQQAFKAERKERKKQKKAKKGEEDKEVEKTEEEHLEEEDDLMASVMGFKSFN